MKKDGIWQKSLDFQDLRKRVIIVFALLMLLSLAKMAYSARQPLVSNDNDQWGTILNAYLNVTLNENGSIKANVNSSISLWNSTGSGIFPRNLLGKVGIGTHTPAEMLHVVGNVRITGNLTISDLFNFSAVT